MKIGNKCNNLSRPQLANACKTANGIRNINLAGGMSGSYGPNGVTLSSSSVGTDENDYEFKVEEYTNTSVSVTSGHWIRNGLDMSNSTAAEEIAVVPDGTLKYLTASLTQSSNKDPSLIPDDITYTIESTVPANDYYDTKMVIAEINTSASIINDIVQIRTGGRKEDSVQRADTNTFSPTAPVRSTIEKNPTTSVHRGELQLTNVDTCFRDSNSVPYFNAGSDSGGDLGVAGELHWAALDADLVGNPENSIEFASNAAGTAIMQIYGFRTASSAGSLTDTDLLLFKGAGSDIEYISGADLITYIDGSITINCTDVKSCMTTDDWLCEYIKDNCGICDWLNNEECLDPIQGAPHTKLDFLDSNPGDAGQNADHDARHWVKGAGVTSDAVSSNYGDAIGRAVNQQVINLSGLALQDGNTGDPNDCLTWDSTSVDIVDGVLLNVLEDQDSTNSANGALRVIGGIGVAKNGHFGGDVYGASFHINANDYWTPTTFEASPTTSASISAGTTLSLTGVGDVNLGSTGANLLLGAYTDWSAYIGNTCYINASPTTTNIGDAGANRWFRYGWLMNSSGADIEAELVPDGSGGTKEIYILSKDV